MHETFDFLKSKIYNFAMSGRPEQGNPIENNDDTKRVREIQVPTWLNGIREYFQLLRGRGDHHNIWMARGMTLGVIGAFLTPTAALMWRSPELTIVGGACGIAGLIGIAVSAFPLKH